MTTLGEAVNMFKKATKHVLFIGAGISRSSPANIPLFREINSAVLSALDPNLHLIRQSCSSNNEANEIAKTIVSMKPERLLGELGTMLGPRTLRFLDWMDTRQPSSGHLVVAHLVNAVDMKTVLTTNFDLLLESTLPGFLSVHKMKMMTRARISADYEYAFIADKIDVLIPERVESSEKAIFHLHGTIKARSLDITTSNSQVAYDEFDHMNLRPRLEDAMILFAGYSGNDLDDILPLLRGCHPRAAIWIYHSSDDKECISCSFPAPWKTIFSEAYALRGITIPLLSRFADVETIAYDIGTITDFEMQVLSMIRSYSSVESRNRLVAWLTRLAGFPNNALSIYEIISKGVQSMLDMVRQKIVDLRAKAIAISETGGVENLRRASVMLAECAELFKEILPANNNLSPIDIRTTYRWEAREWALLCESMGNIYGQAGKPEALELFDQARAFMIHKDDIDRLEQNYRNIRDLLQREGII